MDTGKLVERAKTLRDVSNAAARRFVSEDSRELFFEAVVGFVDAVVEVLGEGEPWERCGEWYETAGPIGSCNARQAGNCVVEDPTMKDLMCPKAAELGLAGEEGEDECTLADEMAVALEVIAKDYADPDKWVKYAEYVRALAAANEKAEQRAERAHESALEAGRQRQTAWDEKGVADQRAEAAEAALAGEKALNAKWDETFPKDQWDRVAVLRYVPCDTQANGIIDAIRDIGCAHFANALAAGPPERPGSEGEESDTPEPEGGDT